MRKFYFFILLILILSSFTLARTERTASSTTVCENNICTTSLYSGVINYHNGTEFVPITTTIVTSNEANYDYEVSTRLYQVFFKSDPTQGQVVKYVKDDIEITFQPMALNYRNRINQLQQIKMIDNSVDIQINNNQFIYSNAYGNGLDLSYTYNPEFLKEDLIIQNFSSLPLPDQYIIDGQDITLDLDFVLSTNAQHIVIEGEDWDMSSDKSTSEAVYIKDSLGKTLYYLQKPYAYDNNSDRSEIVYTFKKAGNKLYVIKETNYTWLQNAQYPVKIDPTIVVDEGKLSDGSIEETDAVWNTARDAAIGDTFNTIGIAGSRHTDALGYRIWRSYLPFNTSSIRDDATIVEAKACVYALTIFDDDNDGNDFLSIIQTSQDNVSNIEEKDYNNVDTIQGSNRVDLSNIISENWFCFTLNSTGKSWINKTGNTLLGIREGHDLLDISVAQNSRNSLYYMIKNDAFAITFFEIDNSFSPFLNITYTEPVLPGYNGINNNASNSKINGSVKFNASLIDDVGLDTYRFATNLSTIMTNGTAVNINGSSFYSNETITINLTRNNYICGQFWFNDTSGNSNVTSLSCFTVANTIPNATVGITTKPADTTENISTTISYFDADGDVWTFNETRWYNGSKYLSIFNNVTVLNSTDTRIDEIWTFSARVYDGFNWSVWRNDSVVVGDNIAPIIGNYSLTKTAWFSDEFVTFNANCSDNSGQISNMKFTIQSDGFNRTMTEIIANSQFKFNSTTFGVGNYNISFLYCEDISGNINTTQINLEFSVTTRPSLPAGTTGGGSSAPQEVTCNESGNIWSISTTFGQAGYNFGIPFKNAVPVNKDIILTNSGLEPITISLSCEKTDETDIDICDSISFSNNSITIPQNPLEPVRIIMSTDYPEDALLGTDFSFNIIASDNEVCLFRLNNKAFITRLSFSKWKSLTLAGGEPFNFPVVIPAIIAWLIFVVVGIIVTRVSGSAFRGIFLIALIGGAITFSAIMLI